MPLYLADGLQLGVVVTDVGHDLGDLVARLLRGGGGQAGSIDPEADRVGIQLPEEWEERPLQVLRDRAPEHLDCLQAVLVEPSEAEARLVEELRHDEAQLHVRGGGAVFDDWVVFCWVWSRNFRTFTSTLLVTLRKSSTNSSSCSAS